MARKLDLDALLHGCADTSFDTGIRIDVELEPLAGDGGPVKPATYLGGHGLAGASMQPIAGVAGVSDPAFQVRTPPAAGPLVRAEQMQNAAAPLNPHLPVLVLKAVLH